MNVFIQQNNEGICKNYRVIVSGVSVGVTARVTPSRKFGFHRGEGGQDDIFWKMFLNFLFTSFNVDFT